MEEFLDDFKRYMLENTQLIEKSSGNFGTLVFTPNVDKLRVAVQLMFKFEGFYQGVPSSVAIFVMRNNTSEDLKKRMSFADFDRLVRDGTMIELATALITYNLRMIEATQELRDSFQLLLL